MERVRLGLFSVSTPGDEMCDDERDEFKMVGKNQPANGNKL